MKLLPMRFLVVALLASALAAHPAFAKKKSPFTYSCPDDEVHVQWCCPELVDEAMAGAQLVATMVCLDNGFQTFRVVEDDQIVEENHLTVTGRQGEIIIRNMITGIFKVKMFPYQEESTFACRQSAEDAGGHKKIRKWKARIQADIDARQAAGECALTGQDVIDRGRGPGSKN